MAGDWRDYQEESAAFFRALGWKASVNAKVTGARATHQVDVWVTFTRYGLDHRWVIECKHWKSNVPKEKVMSLLAIIQDIGADRGILLSESGFQSGALQAAQITNITLTSLADLRANAENDLLASSPTRISQRISNLQVRMHQLRIAEELEDGSWISAPRPGVDSNNYIRILGELSILEEGLKRAQIGLFPTLYNISGTKEPLVALDLRSLLEGAERVLGAISAWVEQQEENV